MSAPAIKANQPPAVVLGLCAHGLATARVLQRHGVTVHALEPNQSLPGVHTNSAQVHRIDSIHPPELIDELIRFKQTLNIESKAVLFPINDRMVAEVAEHWQRLAPHYELSWSDSLSQVNSLLVKTNLEQHCQQRALNYPKSLVVDGMVLNRPDIEALRFPLLIKPSRPLGSFKTQIIESFDQLVGFVKHVEADLPLVLQEWIAGSDESLFFCAMFYRHGECLAHGVGKKLRSQPPAMGQTTSAEMVDNQAVVALAKQFFSDTVISGPVSLELKRDREGRYWVIEPTVGRSDYWVDLCNQNGLPIPAIEYHHVTQGEQLACKVTPRRRWFDTERDSFSFVTLLFTGKLAWPWLPATFTHFDLRDPMPFVFGSKAKLVSLMRRLGRRFLKSKR